MKPRWLQRGPAVYTHVCRYCNMASYDFITARVFVVIFCPKIHSRPDHTTCPCVTASVIFLQHPCTGSIDIILRYCLAWRHCSYHLPQCAMAPTYRYCHYPQPLPLVFRLPGILSAIPASQSARQPTNQLFIHLCFVCI